MAQPFEILFWVSVIAILYAYAGFPVLLSLVAGLRRRRVRRAPIEPTVSLVIAAYNEQRSIGARIANALSADYRGDALEVVIVSDGSDDATDEIVGSIPDPRVRLLSVPRRGKVHALDDAVAVAAGEILVFSDANTLFAPDAIRMLVRNFADAEVAGVAGRKVYTTAPRSESIAGGEAAYWSYDTFLKRMETWGGSTVSADGAIYAIRRTHYRRPADAAVTDDFAISTAVVEQHRRLVFDGDAIAYEAAVPRARQELSRKVRLMTRGLRSVLLRRRLLNPWVYGIYSVNLFSHKVLRRLVPLFLLLLLGTSLAGLSEPLYRAAAALQVLFYSLAAAGWLLRRSDIGRSKLLSLPFYYCLANLAALLAVGRLLLGHRVEHWRPQRHAAETNPEAS